MTQGVERIERYLNYLLVFLLPTQLAIHFWPSFAFLFGIRVDYFAPTVFLTDIFILSLLLIWLIGSRIKILRFIKKYRLPLFLITIFSALNIFHSAVPSLTLIKWLKVFELVALSFYIAQKKSFFSSKRFYRCFFISLVFFSIIGIAQFLNGKTLGGPLHLLGERTFNILTPGIALVKIYGRDYLRAYSTFPHPNAFAGYLGVGTLLIFGKIYKKFFSFSTVGLFIIMLAFLLTFSLSALLAFAVCLVLAIFAKKRAIERIKISNIVLTFILLSIAAMLLSGKLANFGTLFPINVKERMDLMSVAGRVISQNFFFGAGLNTSILEAVNVGWNGLSLWLLQPVHNIYLLIFSEAGIAGMLIFYFVFFLVFDKIKGFPNNYLKISLIFILITGLMDHYWFTLQQNQLIWTVIIGLSLQEKS